MLFGKKNKEKDNKKGKKIASNNIYRSKPVLGIPLREAVYSNKSHDGVLVPVIVRLCIDYVNEHGLESEGIYRISCPKTRLDELEKMANEQGLVNFEEANEAAGLLKRFLRQLPEHILTDQYLDDFDRISALCTCNSNHPCSCSTVKMLRDLLQKIPRENYYLLAYVFLHAQRVVMMSTTNKMNVPALGVLLQAILNLPRNTVRIFLLNASDLLNTSNMKINYLFEDVILKKYKLPMDAHMIKECMPTTEIDLKDELKKQESYLNELKIQMAELNGKLKSDEKKRRENEINDVQGNIEAINKRLKLLHGKNISENYKTIDNQKKLSDTNINSALTSCEDDNTNFNAFEEKHLMEIGSKIRSELAEEKEKIAKLIVDLNNKLQKLQTYDALSSDVKLLTEEEKEYWKEECEKENEKRRILLADIHSLRDECAMLRGSIEQCNLVSKNYLQTQI